MTSKERFARMYAHKEADRIPIIDSPWAGAFRRWHREGLPADADWFGIDKTAGISVDITPRYPQKVLEENDGYIFSSDHSIPNSVSLENFQAIIAEVKRCGTY